jgi:hypothetical protein
VDDVHGASNDLVEGTLGEQVRFVEGEAVGGTGEVGQELDFWGGRGRGWCELSGLVAEDDARHPKVVSKNCW